MKLDTHVHTFHSGDSTIWPLQNFLRECYTGPEDVYRLAKARGMGLVTVTDHDEIGGVLALADRPDVITGCEVTGVFPDDGVKVHLNVFGPTEAHHREIQRARHDVRYLMRYLRGERLFTSLNHVASGINGPITAPHVAALLPWVNALETINGSRLAVQNRTARCIAEAAGKTGIAGSDSHTHRGIGYTWTEVPGAKTRDEFLAGLWEGRTRVGGRDGSLPNHGVRRLPVQWKLLDRASATGRPSSAAVAVAREVVRFGLRVADRPDCAGWRVPPLNHGGALQREPAVRSGRASGASRPAPTRTGRRNVRVAVFTDNDFSKVNGLTTTLTALVAHAPADIRSRVYTAADLACDTPDYLALPSRGMPIPFYGKMRM